MPSWGSTWFQALIRKITTAVKSMHEDVILFPTLKLPPQSDLCFVTKGEFMVIMLRPCLTMGCIIRSPKKTKKHWLVAQVLKKEGQLFNNFIPLYRGGESLVDVGWSSPSSFHTNGWSSPSSFHTNGSLL